MCDAEHATSKRLAGCEAVKDIYHPTVQNLLVCMLPEIVQDSVHLHLSPGMTELAMLPFACSNALIGVVSLSTSVPTLHRFGDMCYHAWRLSSIFGIMTSCSIAEQLCSTSFPAEAQA